MRVFSKDFFICDAGWKRRPTEFQEKPSSNDVFNSTTQVTFIVGSLVHMTTGRISVTSQVEKNYQIREKRHLVSVEISKLKENVKSKRSNLK